MRKLAIGIAAAALLLTGIGAAVAAGGGTGTIAGQATDVFGNPIANACVLFDDGANNTIATTTAVDGTYTSPALATGSYRVGFDPQSGATTCNPNWMRNYAQQWWDHAQSWGDATVITVNDQQVITGIDATLVIGGGHIAGTVTDQTGQGLVDACVGLTLLDANHTPVPGGFAYSVTTFGGTYTSRDLTPGTYTVAFGRPRTFHGSFARCSTDDLVNAQHYPTDVVVAPAATTTGIDATETVPHIRGTVEDSNGRPAAGVCVGVFDIDDSINWSEVRTAADGTYVSHPLTGTNYKVSFVKSSQSFCQHDDFFSRTARWWNEQLDYEHANAIAITSAADVTGINGIVPIVSHTTKSLHYLLGTGDLNTIAGAAVTVNCDGFILPRLPVDTIGPPGVGGTCFAVPNNAFEVTVSTHDDVSPHVAMVVSLLDDRGAVVDSFGGCADSITLGVPASARTVLVQTTELPTTGCTPAVKGTASVDFSVV